MHRDSQSSRQSSIRNADSRQDPLVVVIDEYLALVESGATVDIEAFVGRYPGFGQELRDCLEALDLVARVTAEPPLGVK